MFVCLCLHLFLKVRAAGRQHVEHSKGKCRRSSAFSSWLFTVDCEFLIEFVYTMVVSVSLLLLLLLLLLRLLLLLQSKSAELQQSHAINTQNTN